MPIYEELVQKYPVRYIAGGAAQNSIRGAQVVPPSKPYINVS
jgi:adenosine kinase